MIKNYYIFDYFYIKININFINFYIKIKKININFITKKIKNDLYNCLNLKSIY